MPSVVEFNNSMTWAFNYTVNGVECSAKFEA